jgi:copper(I)-binding protein
VAQSAAICAIPRCAPIADILAMRRTQIILPAAVAIALTLVAGFYFAKRSETAPAQIAVTQAWARATPPGADVGAIYLTVENKGGAADRLVSVTSPAAQSAMLHQTVEESGVSTMREADGSIAAGTTLEMKPGGSHIMLMGLKAPLKEGDTIDVTLAFEKTGEVKATAKVQPIGANTAAE